MYRLPAEEGSTGEVLDQLDDAIAENQTELQELDGEDAIGLNPCCDGYFLYDFLLIPKGKVLFSLLNN